VVVEDWSKVPVGTKGRSLPAGATQSWGSPKYDFEVVAEGSGRVLRVLSEGDSSTINKEIKIDCKDYPILQWSWKVMALPKGADARKKETDDEAAQVYVTFPASRRRALARDRLYLGHHGARRAHFQEPEDGARHLRGDALGRGGSGQVAHGIPQRL
jgi:hypothetical protein